MAYGFAYDENPGYTSSPPPQVPSKFDPIPSTWFTQVNVLAVRRNNGRTVRAVDFGPDPRLQRRRQERHRVAQHQWRHRDLADDRQSVRQRAGSVVRGLRRHPQQLADRRTARLQRRRQSRPVVEQHQRRHLDLADERHPGVLHTRPRLRRQRVVGRRHRRLQWRRFRRHPLAQHQRRHLDLADDRDRDAGVGAVGDRPRLRPDELVGGADRRLQRRRQEPTFSGTTPTATPRSG